METFNSAVGLLLGLLWLGRDCQYKWLGLSYRLLYASTNVRPEHSNSPTGSSRCILRTDHFPSLPNALLDSILPSPEGPAFRLACFCLFLINEEFPTNSTTFYFSSLAQLRGASIAAAPTIRARRTSKWTFQIKNLLSLPKKSFKLLRQRK